MIRLCREPFDAAAELARFSDRLSGAGAIVSFVGLARGQLGQPALELEAYPGFTEKEIGRMVEGARERFALADVSVIHRHGPIAGGEAIVLVLAAAAHRREAFEACDFLMDYLKARAPLWKKELGPNGARWVEPTARDQADLERWQEQN